MIEYCPECGAEVDMDDWDYCPFCGEYLKGFKVTSNE